MLDLNRTARRARRSIERRHGRRHLLPVPVHHLFPDYSVPAVAWDVRNHRKAQGFMPKPRTLSWQPCFFSWKLDWTKGLWVIDVDASNIFWRCIWQKIEATHYRPWYEQHFETPELSLDRFRWKATGQPLPTFCLSDEWADHPLIFECGPGRKYKIDPELSAPTQQQFDAWMGAGLCGAVLGQASRIEWAGADVEYFLSTSGSDSNSGLSEAAPWLTFAKFVSTAAAGDILTLIGGTYNDFLNPTSTNKDGSSGTKTRVRPRAGDTVIINPTSHANAGIHFQSRAHAWWECGRTGTTLIIDGSGVGSNPPGVRYSEGTNNIIMRNVEVRDFLANGGAFHQGTTCGNNHQYLDCVAHHNGVDFQDHGFYPGIGSGMLFEGGQAYSNSGFGYHIYNSTCTSFTMRRVRGHINGTAVATSYGCVIGNGCDGGLVYNSIFDHHLTGTGARGGIAIIDSCSGHKLLNLTVYANTGTGIDIGAGVTGTEIKNCVSHGNSVANYTNNGSSTDAANNSVTGASPLFTDAEAGDFTLQETSPLIDAGQDLTSDGVTDDIIGTARPDGAAYDIGAYEFVGAVTPPPSGGGTIDYAFAEQNTPQTFSSTTYADVSGASITSGEFTVGKQYLLLVTAQISDNAGTNGVAVKVRHGTTDFADSEQFWYAGTANNYTTYTWFTVWTAVSGEAVTMQGKRLGGNMLTVDKVAMAAMNLSDDLTQNTDWFFNEVTTDSALSTTHLAGATVTFTPAAASDWLVLTLARTDHADNTTAALTRLVRSGEASSTAPSTRFYMITRIAGADFSLQMLGRVFTLGTASNTFTEETATSTGTTISRVYSAVFALNLEKFAGHAFAYTDGDTSLSATDYATQLQTVDLTLAESTDVLMGAYWGFDRGSFDRDAEFRLQAYIVGQSQVDQPAGQTTANRQFDPGGSDSSEEDPLNLVTLAALTGGNTYRLDLDASANSTTGTPTGQHRCLWAFTMELVADPTGPTTSESVAVALSETVMVTPAFTLTADPCAVRFTETAVAISLDPPVVAEVVPVGVTDSISAPVVPIYVTETE